MSESPLKDLEIVKPQGRPEILAKDIGKETILYFEADEALHVLNSTAKLIWSLCDGEHSLEDIERQIREDFTVPEQQDVLADVQHTIQVFSDKGLLLSGEILPT